MPLNATNTTETAVEAELKRGRSRRAGTTPVEIRELEKMFTVFFAGLDSFLKTGAERLSKQMSAAIEASHRRDASVKADLEKLRSDLNTLSGGLAEQLVRKCGDEEMLARFRRCGWRV